MVGYCYDVFTDYEKNRCVLINKLKYKIYFE